MTTQEFNVEDLPVLIKWHQRLAIFAGDDRVRPNSSLTGLQPEQLLALTKLEGQSILNIKVQVKIELLEQRYPNKLQLWQNFIIESLYKIDDVY